jgi:catechol 2,3-dioxygenase-like lactoylglutathione lyase family enzyme
MHLHACTPVFPGADLERSLRFWVDGLGLTIARVMHRDGRLVGCMMHNERLAFWLNGRDGDMGTRTALASRPTSTLG